MLMLYAVSEANGGLGGIEALEGVTPRVQLILLAGGIALIGLGLGGVGRITIPSRQTVVGAIHELPLLHTPSHIDDSSVSHRAPQGVPLRRWWARRGTMEIALVLALTALALLARFWELGERVRVMVDEGHFALGITYFWSYPDVKLLEPMPTAASFPFIFSYGQMGLVDLLGRSFLGLRAFSAILGALTVPALYLLARELYDRRTALLAALVLVTFPPHLHYSRLALNNIADPLFGTLGLALLARGLRTNARRDYAWAGVALGLTQYFYEGGRLLFPPLAFGWLLGGLVVWRPRPSLRGIVTAGLAFVLVALPVYYTLHGLDFPLVDRLDKTQLDSGEYWDRDREPDTLQTRLAHFRHSLLMYVNHPENTLVYYYLYYGGEHPLVLEYIVPALLLGAVIALWGWRRPGVLPLLWVLATSAGNALLVESAVTARYVVAFPALALLIALGVRHTLSLLWPVRLPRRVPYGLARGLAFAPVLLVIAAITVGQAYFYFGPFLDHFNVEVREHVEYDVEDALLRALDFPPGTEIHVVGYKTLPQLDAQRFLNFMADGLTVYMWEPHMLTEENIAGLSRANNQVFFFPADNIGTLATLASVFGTLRPRANPGAPVPDKSLLMVHIPADPDAEPPHAVGWLGR